MDKSDVTEKPLDVESLILDERNPRFPKPLTQDEMIAHFAASPKTLRLAAHIAAHGISPLDLPAVSPSQQKPDRYVVKEGNRRLAALKLLANPYLARQENLVERYRKIVKEATSVIPSRIQCAVFGDASSADEWMSIRHTGENEGAGLVGWDTMQRGRFNMRSGRSGQHATAFRYLDDAVSEEWVTEEEANSVNLSSLTRVLKDRGVQRILHAKVGPDGVAFRLAGDGRKRLARRLVEDWRSEGGLRVEVIYDKEKRRDYAERLKAALDLTEDSSATHEVPSDAQEGGAAPNKPRSLAPQTRAVLVPRSFRVSAPAKLHRVDPILSELKRLKLAPYPNAIAVLFRTFIEMSVNSYLERKNLPRNQRDTLSQCTERAIKHLEASKGDTVKRAIKPVRAAFSSPGGLFSLATLHEYVHNPQWHPVPSELRRHWDNYEPFLALLWA